MPQYAVGIDSGTQGTKALVVEADSGRVLGRGKSPHAMIGGLGPGASEQDPAVWIEAMEAALAAAMKQARIDPAKVVAMGVSGQQHGFVPLDAKGRVIRPAKLWNDTSTIRETGDLIAGLGGKKAVIDRLGISPAVGFTASKILWLKRHEPAAFRPSRDRPSAPQLPELLADRPGPHGVRRRLRHRPYGHPQAPLGRGGRGRDRPGAGCKAPAAQPPQRARGLRQEIRGRAIRLRPRACCGRRRRQHDGRDRQRQRRAGRVHAQSGNIRDRLFAFRPALRRPRRRDRGLLRQHGRLAAAALHDERDQHDGDREVALRTRQHQARAAGPKGRTGRGRPRVPALRRWRARPGPPLFERRLLRPRPPHIRCRPYRPSGHGGRGPQLWGTASAG